MDSQSVKERLLRLNDEIHDERFAGRDLNAVVALWDEAKTNYRNSNFGITEDLIDKAYALLYSPQSPKQEPQVQTAKQATQQAAPQNVAQVQEVQAYRVYDSEADRITSVVGEFLNMSLCILMKPSRVFTMLSKAKAVSETLAYFMIFGIIFAIISLSLALPEIGLSMEAVQAMSTFVVVGFLYCLLAAYLTFRVMAGYKGKGSFDLTSSVFGFSLVPVILTGLLFIYLMHGTALLQFNSNTMEDSAVGMLVAAAIIACGLTWNIYLQSIGLNLIHQIPRERCALAAAIADAASMVILAFLGVAFYMSGAAEWLL